MAALFYYIALSCIVFLALQQVASGLTCYACASCNTVDSNTATQTVSNSSGYSCVKFLTLAAGSVVSTVRSVETNCVELNAVAAGTGTRRTCCTTDRCNGGISLAGSLSLALCVVVIAVFRRF